MLLCVCVRALTQILCVASFSLFCVVKLRLIGSSRLLRHRDLLQKYSSISATAISPGYSRRYPEARPGNVPVGMAVVPVSISISATERSSTCLCAVIFVTSVTVALSRRVKNTFVLHFLRTEALNPLWDRPETQTCASALLDFFLKLMNKY